MITIAPKLKQLLDQKPLLSGAVTLVFSTCDQVLQWSKLPFFPDYTDHGYNHLSDVFATIETLITDASLSALTCEDAAVAILSVLFHDLGMYITEDGFLSLVDPSNTKILIPEIDSESWPRRWELFMSEARHFDQKMLLRIFGDVQPIVEPPKLASQMSEQDRRLIGEFIRRHHPRLAHEFAVSGFAGAGTKIEPPSQTPTFILELSGLVARSHGSDLRAFIPLLKKKYHPREYQGVHAVFLMAVLRIADYLQIQGSRAPELPLKLHRIPSTFSLREWRTHQAVTNLTRHDDDPESLYVQTSAKSPDVYLHLKSLFGSLQLELDVSWAVLGEIYGRISELSGLGLTIRRIRSDIEDQPTITPGDFVRARFSFESAGADLLKLLAEPLYGGNANFGVRELVQNSVDAVLELRSVGKTSGTEFMSFAQQEDVDISLDCAATQGCTLRVTDKGIGMDREILTNYFLRAGASYRQSSGWQKEFTDQKGHSRILRSGRFGIGVLAAFILGDEIKVKTRHYSREFGIEFRARLETDPIDARYVVMPVGTEITIKLNETSARQLEKMLAPGGEETVNFGSLPSYLYLLKDPSLSIRVNSKAVPRTQIWPAANQNPLPSGWNRFKPESFAEVQWTYDGEGELACNGIAVASPFANSKLRGSWSFSENAALGSDLPTLSIFDPDGNLGLKLDRTSLTTRRLPFEESLVKDIYRDMAAWCLAVHEEEDLAQLSLRKPDRIGHPAVGSETERRLIFLENGFTVLTPKLALEQDLHTINKFYFLDPGIGLPRPAAHEGSMRGEMGSAERQRDKVLRRTVAAVLTQEMMAGYTIIGARLITALAMLERWKRKVSKRYFKPLTHETRTDGWISMTVGTCKQSSIMLEPFVPGGFYSFYRWPIIVQYYVEKDIRAKDATSSRIAESFLKDIGSSLIPYVRENRKALSGYPSLSRQIQFHKKRLEKGNKHKANNQTIPKQQPPAITFL